MLQVYWQGGDIDNDWDWTSELATGWLYRAGFGTPTEVTQDRAIALAAGMTAVQYSGAVNGVGSSLTG